MKKMNMKKATKNLGAFRGIEGLPARRGGIASNQSVVKFENGDIFQSYNSIIGVRLNGEVYLSHLFDCSKTTMYYLKQWLGVYVGEVRRRLTAGTYGILAT